MGEAQRREKETGEKGPKKFYAESDLCPSCGKTLVNMDKENNGKILTAMGGAFVICCRCGNLFMLQSKVKILLGQVDRKIIDPKSAEGLAIQQAASKIVLPGDGK